MAIFLTIILCIACLGSIVWIVLRKYRRGHYDLWVPAYIRHLREQPPDLSKRQRPLHLIVSLADHFEPADSRTFLREWIENYRPVAERHHDSSGIPFKRTFHYPVEQFHDFQIEMLLPLCREGLAEIEFQIHHFEDTSETLRQKIEEGLRRYAKYGICQTIDEPAQTRFAFVHGNWALDNSRPDISPNPCGVNDEISILRSLGCYIDVTFPSVLTMAQPRHINSICYVTDDPEKPKSHDTGVPVEVGKPPTGDLMLLQGPLLVDWRDWRHGTHPTIENAEIHKDLPLHPRRIGFWIKANVHVLGQPNWLFIKLHSHGCRAHDLPSIYGESFSNTLTHLETHFDDGENYQLHYTTIRETFNIIKAAEAGKTGNPEQYRDFVIKPYRANKS